MLIWILLIWSIVLAVLTPIIRTWVNFTVTATELLKDDDYTGSLFAVSEFYQGYEGTTLVLDNYAWDCIAKPGCEINDDGTICNTFEPLMDAGRLYLNIELTVIGLLLLWHDFFVYSICWSRERGHPRLNHILPHLAWILHLAAVVCWSLISEVEFQTGECENENPENGDQLDICISVGPILMIV